MFWVKVVPQANHGYQFIALLLGPQGFGERMWTLWDPVGHAGLGWSYEAAMQL